MDKKDEGCIGLCLSESFAPYDEKNAEVYETISGWCASTSAEFFHKVGFIFVRWLLLHAHYRMGDVPRVLVVPAQIVSLSCGLLVYLAVYFETHPMSGDNLLAACESWIVTVRDANREARRLREQESGLHAN